MTHFDDDPRDLLLERLYPALLDAALWPDAAREIGAALDGTAYLFEFGADGRHTARYCTPEAARPLLEMMSAIQTAGGRNMLSFLLAEAELMAPYCKQQLSAEDTAALHLELAPGLVQAHGLLARVYQSDAASAVFLLLSHPDGPGLSPANFPFTRRLIRTLNQALGFAALHRQQGQELLRQRMLVRHEGTSAILVDVNRRVVATTPGGIDALSAADLFDTRTGRLQILPKTADDLLADLIDEARAGWAQTDQGTGPVSRQRDTIHIRSDGNLCRFVLRTVWPTTPPIREGTHGHVLVTLREPGPIARDARDALQGTYGLSRSEARLAYYLAMTGSLGETLETLGITRNTGKTHLRRIYEKTGVTSQIELCKLVAKLSALY
ncbi:hypothetical protein GWI72_11315 [Microvirga tunisiensis]|uniref:HTH luxR-type domain-containing protein n=1 Tax=Pannonibacter tanglangensis TaxID=2750084 RepID=A0A7X5J8T5_9HYPH|nr:hypothetical protein [Pannonibacter sp. XCT-53]NBN78857.1 hypothetical protein [Pannonibacter sp. XCT-53]